MSVRRRPPAMHACGMGGFVIVPPAGDPLPGSFEVTVRVRSSHTNGVLAVVEETLAPKAFITPHVHRNDVWVYVLTGEIGVLVGDDLATARAGAWALKPRDVQHSMWNPGGEPARIVEVLTPGGSEAWFEELADLDPADREGFERACRRHGIEFLHDSTWTATLRDRFSLG
jgi:quercetin dioxygenase-like cupin family protein